MVTEPSRHKRGIVPSGARDTNPNRVLQILQDRITSGIYVPGVWLPTEREIAHDLSVNRSAVRDALLRLEHNGLIERRPGCRPRVSVPGSDPGRERAGASSRVIAVVTPQHESDFASREIVRGISRVLRTESTPYRQSLFDVIVQSHEPYRVEQEACDALEAGEAAGAIVWPTLHPQVLASWERVRDLGYPVVLVDRFDSTMSCDFVGVDNYCAAREAVEYLLGLGHTRIAHLTTSEPVSAVNDRRTAYLDAMENAGLQEYTSVWTVRQNHVVETAEVIDKHIEAHGLPTAIFAVNDHGAYRCIHHLGARGVRVPDQVSIVGFDDIDRFSPRAGFLTSMRQPFERIGQEAANLILKRLNWTGSKPEPYLHKLLPTRLIERLSCRSII